MCLIFNVDCYFIQKLEADWLVKEKHGLYHLVKPIINVVFTVNYVIKSKSHVYSYDVNKKPCDTFVMGILLYLDCKCFIN